MFQGTIPGPVRSLVREQARGWRCKDVYVACSGTFTSERVVGALGRFRLHGNDVTLYSCALGKLMVDELLPVRVKPEWKDEFGWLDEWVATPLDVAATVQLAGSMLTGLGRDNVYYDRQRAAYRADWKRLHAETKKKLERRVVPLESFHAGDAYTWVRDLPSSGAVITFPPFETGGYEAMFAGLHEVFSWPAPEYELFTDERRREFLDMVMRRREWVIATNYDLEEASDRQVGLVKPTSRSVAMRVYAGSGRPRIQLPRQQTAPLLVPYLGPHDTLGETLSLRPLKPAQFAALRSLYLNPGIAIAGADTVSSFAVLADGKLVGAFAITTHRGLAASTPEMRLPQPTAFLMADFPVRPTAERNLAKLVLYAALSREAQLLYERGANKRVPSLVTAAFAKRPTSMKYRGVFDLLTRRENDEKPGEWVLTYGAPTGRWTLAEGLEMWRAKHA